MRKRFGVVKRSAPERRTFDGVVYDSLLECSRAQQLAALESTGLTWEPHPEFTLGCPENTYTADFRAFTPDDQSYYWNEENLRSGCRTRSVLIPNGWVEEVKGPVKTGVGRLKKLWKAYGTVPLVILTAVGKSAGSQQWNREVILPCKKEDGRPKP